MPNQHSTLTALFTDIASAIREKDGTSASKVADAIIEGKQLRENKAANTAKVEKISAEDAGVKEEVAAE